MDVEVEVGVLVDVGVEVKVAVGVGVSVNVAVGVRVGVDVVDVGELGLEAAVVHFSLNIETHVAIPKEVKTVTLHQKPHLDLEGLGLKPMPQLPPVVLLLIARDSNCFL